MRDPARRPDPCVRTSRTLGANLRAQQDRLHPFCHRVSPSFRFGDSFPAPLPGLAQGRASRHALRRRPHSPSPASRDRSSFGAGGSRPFAGGSGLPAPGSGLMPGFATGPSFA